VSIFNSHLSSESLGAARLALARVQALRSLLQIRSSRSSSTSTCLLTISQYSIAHLLFVISWLPRLSEAGKIAHVGSCDDATSSPRTLKLLNTNHGRVISEVTFDTPVLALKMNRHRLVVFLEARIVVYDMRSASELHTIPLSYVAKKGLQSCLCLAIIS
jgi:hypothetical protein